MTADIELNNYVQNVGGMNVTLDLNGHTLSRNLSAATLNGEVIYISYQDAALTVMNGTISGGWASNGTAAGGIYVADGAVTLNNVVITGCKANDGGAIKNEAGGTVTMTGCTLTGNESVDHGGGGIVNYGTVTLTDVTITGNKSMGNGGGIWQGGTLNMAGNIQIHDNTSSSHTHNLYLYDDKVITVTGALDAVSDIRIAGEGLPRVVTTGWSDYMTQAGKDVIKTEIGGSAVMDAGEVGLSVYYYEPNTYTTPTPRYLYKDKVTQFTGTLSDGWYVAVKSMTVSSRPSITSGKVVNLIIPDGFMLQFTSGINVKTGGELHIFGQKDDAGLLKATVEDDYLAGIGGNDEEYNGKIVINGATVDATGGKYAAGIGTGDDATGSGYIESGITIYGGIVKAQGGKEAAGIGSGNEATHHAPYIIIYGGKVTATGGEYGAGIGGGDETDVGGISIQGGEVTATGGQYGAAIGAGYQAGDFATKTIEITGGTVTATSGESAAAIGGGFASNADGFIEISGGTVTALTADLEKKAGAAIGSGAYSDLKAEGGDWCGEIKIMGGTVHATGGGYTTDMGSRFLGGSAAIGGGNGGNMTGTITISGGDVYAKGGVFAPSIGAGHRENYTLVTIGGNMTGTVNVTGGFVHVVSNKYEPGSYFIGASTHEEGIGTLNIGPGMQVYDYAKDLVLEPSQWIEQLQKTYHINYGMHIRQCPNHELSYTFDENNHTAKCHWCNYTYTEPHRYDDTYGCTVCGACMDHWIWLDDNLEGRNTARITTYCGTDFEPEVTMWGHTMYKDGRWNTIVLPLKWAVKGSIFESATVAQFESATMDGSSVDICFSHLYDTDMASADGIYMQSGVPYIVKWDSGDNIINPFFADVNIDNIVPKTISAADGRVEFVGTYDAFTYDASDYDIYCISSDNQLLNAADSSVMAACGAYIRIHAYNKPADLNGDGHVDVADVSILIDMVLGRHALDMDGDVNNDGQLDVADVACLIEYVLYGRMHPLTITVTGV